MHGISGRDVLNEVFEQFAYLKRPREGSGSRWVCGFCSSPEMPCRVTWTAQGAGNSARARVYSPCNGLTEFNTHNGQEERSDYDETKRNALPGRNKAEDLQKTDRWALCDWECSDYYAESEFESSWSDTDGEEPDFPWEEVEVTCEDVKVEVDELDKYAVQKAVGEVSHVFEEISRPLGRST